MSSSLGRRNCATLRAAARVLIPSGGTIPQGADDVGLADRISSDLAGWPPRVRRRVRALLTALEYLPLVSGHRRRFSRLPAEKQAAFLEANYRHRRAHRRTIVGYVKQLCYSAFLACPEVEEAVGYLYECKRPRAGVTGRQAHH